jgi:phosphate-selective porin OprO and OprP
VKGSAGWDKYFQFSSEDGNWTLRLKAYVQPRFTYTKVDNPGTDDDEDKGDFKVKRVDIAIEGTVIRPELEYRCEMESATGSDLHMNDAYVNYKFANEFQIRLGQGHVLFSPQAFTSSGALMFTERSLAGSAFGGGRDQGVVFQGLLGKGKFAYNAGIFNGNGTNQSANDNNDFLYVWRVDFMPLGNMAYDEDLGGWTDSTRLGIGAKYARNLLEPKEGHEEDGELTSDIWGLDFRFAAPRVTACAEYFWDTEKPDHVESHDAQGYYIQAGVFVVPAHWELGLRYSDVDPNRDNSDDRQREVRGGINYYFQGHSAKLQLDVASKRTDVGPDEQNKSTEVTLQGQIRF